MDINNIQNKGDQTRVLGNILRNAFACIFFPLLGQLSFFSFHFLTQSVFFLSSESQFNFLSFLFLIALQAPNSSIFIGKSKHASKLEIHLTNKIHEENTSTSFKYKQ